MADENVSADIVHAARVAGLDVEWVCELFPQIEDAIVLDHAVKSDRVLFTFDKDFGDLVFKLGRQASPGVVLLRPRSRSVDYRCDFAVNVLKQPLPWRGNFIVAREGTFRIKPLV